MKAIHPVPCAAIYARYFSDLQTAAEEMAEKTYKDHPNYKAF